MITDADFLGGFVLGCITGGAVMLVISVTACLRLIIENRRLREIRDP